MDKSRRSKFNDVGRRAIVASAHVGTPLAREREHPEYHDATSFAALRRSRRLPGLRRSFVVSPRLDPAFAGMTRVGLEGGDEAVVSWRRLRPRSARVVRGADR